MFSLFRSAVAPVTRSLASSSRISAFTPASARLQATTLQWHTSIRQFSATPVAQKYKLKSHSGAKKRWRSIANGLFKRAQAGKSHLNVRKRPGRINALSKNVLSKGGQNKQLARLLPYGSD